MQDKLFDRYEIKEEDREYYIPGELTEYTEDLEIIMPRLTSLAQ